MTEPTVYPSNADYVQWANEHRCACRDDGFDECCLIDDPDGDLDGLEVLK